MDCTTSTNWRQEFSSGKYCGAGGGSRHAGEAQQAGASTSSTDARISETRIMRVHKRITSMIKRMAGDGNVNIAVYRDFVDVKATFNLRRRRIAWWYLRFVK